MIVGGWWEQIVIPQTYRSEILKLAHDNPLSGHLGINKTFDRILRCFFWPGLKGDVRHHVVKLVMFARLLKLKPSLHIHFIQSLLLMSRLSVCRLTVFGPFHRTKSGSSCCFKALVKFFSVFGPSQNCTVRQGTNFYVGACFCTSYENSVTSLTCIRGAYHPESQGAIERFQDWDEGVHLSSELVFAHTVRGPLRLCRRSGVG
ncbi:hypothetical protein N1851_026730 [Merluccius polli]|uniref:Gypsy retrotransposon integrase-like protein 1 n=1 Tax=Merluccius polli TaxID=89951 RepID=A0AA47MB80_MERPO|nr:hypothetical protein N1851_026730 [Merluccius polli]